MFRPKRPRSQSTSPSKVDYSKCTICDESTSDDAMECTWCEMVQHRTCCKISVEQCTVLGELTGNIVFLCSTCMQNVPSAFRLYDDSKELHSSIESKIQSLETNLLAKINLITDSCDKTTQDKEKASTSMLQVQTLCDSIKKKHDQLQNDVSSLASKMNDMHQNIQSKLSSLSSEVIQSPTTPHSAIEAMNELDDRNRRKCNLIVHKLPEDSKDEETFLSICKDVLGLDAKIVTIKRLGQQRGWPRLLLVVLENEDIKRQILARSPRLRQSDSWKTVFITPDLTRQEREEGKRLRDELKRRRQNGESNLIIKRGRIIVSSQRSNPTLSKSQPNQSS